MQQVKPAYLFAIFFGGLAILLGGCAQQLPLDDIPFLSEPTATPTLAPTPAPTTPPTPNPYSLTGLRRFVEEIEAVRLGDRQAMANQYMALLPPGPLQGDGEAAFLYQGPGFEVLFNGDLNNWIREEALLLTRVENTDFWYMIIPLNPAARLDYKLVVDGVEQLDPRNPLTEVSGLGPRSKLVMNGYQPPAELRPDLPPLGREERGKLDSHTLESAALEQTRTVFVYVPARPATGRLPTVYFQDGTDYLNLIETRAILDRLIASEEIPPLLAVFVPPIDRQGEYLLNEDYVNYLAAELVPFIQRTYNTSTAPARTAILGPSLGGLAAVYAAVSRPDIFGLVASQSGALSLEDDAVIRQVRLQSKQPTRYHLVVGSYETAIAGLPEGDFLDANRRFVDLLRQKGNEVSYEEFPEGHSWGLWRDRLGDALRYLFAEK